MFNIYSLDLTTAEVTQYTDVVGGCFAPVEMAERSGDRNVVFTSLFEGHFPVVPHADQGAGGHDHGRRAALPNRSRPSRSNRR